MDRNCIVKFKWLDKVKQVLNENGLGHVWLSQGTDVYHVWLKEKIVLVLRDSFVQSWTRDVNTMSKCNMYKLFKVNFGCETYMNELSDDLRYFYTRFRCRNSRLPVETASYNLIRDDSDTICKLCDATMIGDEFHYLFVCNFFERERRKFVPNYFAIYPTYEKMASLLMRHSVHTRNIAVFIKIVMKKLYTAS